MTGIDRSPILSRLRDTMGGVLLSTARVTSSCLVIGIQLWACGTAWSQTCTGTCNDQRCTDRSACTTTFETCLANAGGDPTAQALCLQQRDACLTAVDEAFVGCAGHCSSDPCIQLQCGPNFGMAITRCNDQHFACIMVHPTPEVCDAVRLACVAEANVAYRTCILNACTTTCTVSLEAIPWSAVKHLYRE